MEIVLRGTENNKHDLYFETDVKGNVTLTIKSKNNTGEYTVGISSKDFDFLCKTREMLISENARMKDTSFDRLWHEYYKCCEDCVGNGCDDCRSCEESKKKNEIYKKIQILRNENRS